MVGGFVKFFFEQKLKQETFFLESTYITPSALHLYY
jgi:hypothetical protein